MATPSIRFISGVPYFIDDSGTSYRVGYWLTTSGTWDPPNLTAGTQATQTFALAAAAFGNPVICSFSLDLQGLQLTAYVSSVGVITAVIHNGTAGAVNLNSGTVRFAIARFLP